MKVLQFKTDKEREAAIRVDRLITLMERMNAKSKVTIPVGRSLDDYANGGCHGTVQFESVYNALRGCGRDDLIEGERSTGPFRSE